MGIRLPQAWFLMQPNIIDIMSKFLFKVLGEVGAARYPAMFGLYACV